MVRTDWRHDRSERSLEPPDDGLDDEEREAREQARERWIEKRIDEMREEDR